jgi:hypothetical protein
MYPLNEPARFFDRFQKKNKHIVFQTQTPAQKKYFSLMLVPSYSYGKTHSVRISHNTLYILLFAILATAVIVSFLFVQSRFFRQAAEEISITLEHAQAAYASLLKETEQELGELTEGVILLHSDLTEERARTQEEMQQLRDSHIESLESIWLYTESLEQRLRQYDIYRQEIMAQLSESAHIPAVGGMLHDMQMAQLSLVSTLEDLYGISAAVHEEAAEHRTTMLLLAHSPNSAQSDPAEDAARNLVYYIAMLELALEAQKELYSQLKEQVSVAAPLIRRDRYGPKLWEWSYVRNILPRNTPVMITDVRTRTTLWINSFSHGNHADVFPVTPEDTAALHRVFNNRWSWDTRPIWVHIDGVKVAASINGMPHAGGGNRGNNMTGHICIHFRGSRTHSGSRAHERDHQNSVMEAYRANP